MTLALEPRSLGAAAGLVEPSGVTSVHTVAHLSRQIAVETHRILGDSSDGVARRSMLALTEVSVVNAKAATEAASDLDRISDGLREASRRFQT